MASIQDYIPAMHQGFSYAGWASSVLGITGHVAAYKKVAQLAPLQPSSMLFKGFLAPIGVASIFWTCLESGLRLQSGNHQDTKTADQALIWAGFNASLSIFAGSVFTKIPFEVGFISIAVSCLQLFQSQNAAGRLYESNNTKERGEEITFDLLRTILLFGVYGALPIFKKIL